MQQKLTKHENVGAAVAFDDSSVRMRAGPRVAVQQQITLRQQQPEQPNSCDAISVHRPPEDLLQRCHFNAMEMQKQTAQNLKNIFDGMLDALTKSSEKHTAQINSEVMKVYAKEREESAKRSREDADRASPSKRSRSAESEEPLENAD